MRPGDEILDLGRRWDRLMEQVLLCDPVRRTALVLRAETLILGGDMAIDFDSMTMMWNGRPVASLSAGCRYGRSAVMAIAMAYARLGRRLSAEESLVAVIVADAVRRAG